MHAVRESIEIRGGLAEHAGKGIAPVGDAAEAVGWILGHPPDCVAEDAGLVAGRECKLQRVRLLKELDRRRQEFLQDRRDDLDPPRRGF